jgi:hypothetical protein
LITKGKARACNRRVVFLNGEVVLAADVPPVNFWNFVANVYSGVILRAAV